MRKHPPRFARVLSLLVGGAAVAIVLARQGGGHPTTGTEPLTIGIGPTHACVTTRAQAQAEERSAIVITATAQAPVAVTERASGSKGIATITRSEVATARIQADQPVAVRRSAAAEVRACANNDSYGGARTAALARAYALALSAAHARASSGAAGELATVIHEQYPLALTQGASQGRRPSPPAGPSGRGQARGGGEDRGAPAGGGLS